MVLGGVGLEGCHCLVATFAHCTVEPGEDMIMSVLHTLHLSE